jgi:hypothetical protein
MKGKNIVFIVVAIILSLAFSLMGYDSGYKTGMKDGYDVAEGLCCTKLIDCSGYWMGIQTRLCRPPNVGCPDGFVCDASQGYICVQQKGPFYGQ